MLYATSKTENNVGIMERHNESKICQWYCCSCGQSYGLIIYKEDGETPKTVDHIEEQIPIQQLKYYSLLLYNGSIPTTPNYDYLGSANSGDLSREHYFDSMKKSSSMSELNDYSKCRLSDIVPEGHSLSTVPLARASPSHFPNGLFRYNDKVSVHIPTRFNCHRCNHMMCPYCLKIRLRDLDN